MKSHILPIICISLLASFGNVAAVSADQSDAILTNNVVELRETVSPQGFVHPGISCNAETLSVMREKVKAGVSPWVDYFEGMRRTKFADPNRKPARVEQILNDGGIGGFAHDAHLAWVQTIMYVVTGNEEYRKLPVEIIKWYGSRTEKSFFPQYFSDSHIKIGKHVNTFCGAVDILRATTPKDPQLAVTQEMVDALQKYCMHPIRKNCIERNDYFMNQHSYAIVGFLASTILGDEVEDYKRAVEWVTVNATSPNQGRNGAIKPQIRLVTRNDATGEPVEPNLQLVEMGRDMPHADGNINYLLTMSKAIDFQKTKVDPVSGTVTNKADGVSPLHFLDDRLPKGAALFAKYNMGYGLRWVPVFSETDPNHPDYGARYDYISPRGRGGFGSAYHYLHLKGAGLNLEKGPLRFIKVAYDYAAAGHDGVRSGVYLDNVHNYGFDFWIGLSAAASDAAPSPEKAKRALSKVLPPLEITYEGRPLQGQQFEYGFVDLSAHAGPGDIYPGSPRDIPLKVMRDADDTGYVRMTIEKEPRTIVSTGRFPQGAGLRVRSNSFVKLSIYRNENFAGHSSVPELYVPDTGGKWRDVITNFDGGLAYIQATPLAGPAILDFDRIEAEPDKVQALSFNFADTSKTVPTYAGAAIKSTFTATTPGKDMVGGAKWAPGKVGTALSLNGNGQYAKLPDGIVADLQDFSISAWVKPDKLDRFARIFDFGDSRENYMFLTPNDGKVLKFAIRTQGNREEQVVLGKEPLKVGSWQHVALTLSGKTGVLYLNGEEVGRNPNLTLKPSGLGKTSQNYIGKSQFPDPFLAGMVDDFTIFNKALSAGEIKTIYTGNGRVDSKTPAVSYKFDQQTVEAAREKDQIEYTARNLPVGAKFDAASSTLSWTPTAKQQGDHLLFVTARNGDTIQTLPIRFHVARDLNAALNYVARAYDPKQKYVSSTEQAFKAALKSRDIAVLQRAAAGLQLLSPRLPDGTLDYRVASGPPPRITNINMMADNDPFTWGGIWGFDKNITMDFGNHFKVKSNAFRMLPRDGHPSRMVEAVVYGSNDRRSWTLLTENKTVRSSSFQTLTVKAEQRNKPYRYLRVFMPAKPLPAFEVAEFRVVGERIEDYSPDYHVAYIAGFNDGTFRPDQKLTKAEAVSLLAGVADSYTDKGAYTSNFVDVPRDAPYYDDVAYMSSKGIGNGWYPWDNYPNRYVVGDAENRFHPESPISRGELAGIMSRMQWLTGDDGPQLKDVTADTPNAAEIRRVAREGWLTGDEAGSFRPDVPVTRAEFVVAVNKMLGWHCATAPQGAPKFHDVEKSHSAYADIIEASTTHAVQSREQQP